MIWEVTVEYLIDNDPHVHQQEVIVTALNMSDAHDQARDEIEAQSAYHSVFVTRAEAVDET